MGKGYFRIFEYLRYYRKCYLQYHLKTKPLL